MNTVLKAEAAAQRTERFGEVRPAYLEALKLVERLHRRLLDVIKDEFDRRGRSDINSVQALLLYNIGDKELTAGELRTRGYYLGSNVSYNVKKLVEMGFLHHARSRIDRRSVRISLTETGQRSASDRRRALREACDDGGADRRHQRRRFRPSQPGADASGALLDRPDPLSPLSTAGSVAKGALRRSFLLERGGAEDAP
jgi:DNA-binding MarR family transcriptional regulator